MDLHDVAFMPTLVSFAPHFSKNVVEVKASGPPHVIKQSLGHRNEA